MIDIIGQLGITMQPQSDQKPICLKSQGREFIGLLGKSHVLDILYFMFNNEESVRFNRLKREMGLTATTLSRRLEKLNNQGLVDREVFAEVPARVEYKLSEKGRTFGPILKSVFSWVERVNS